MTRALEDIKFHWRAFRLSPRVALVRMWWQWMPRPAYCQCCGCWAWCTLENPAYTRPDVQCFLCEDCAEENDRETRLAWSDYYSGLL